MTDTSPAHLTTPPMDDKGRLSPEHMTERALLVELVTNLRVVVDVVDEFSDSPMVKGLMGGGNPLAALTAGMVRG